MPRFWLATLLVLAAFPARADDSTVRAEAETSSRACAGAPALVEGNHNVITFSGACAGVQIRGEGNDVTVALAAGALIDVEGNRNRVRFTTEKGAPPRLRVSGGFVDVSPMLGAAAPAADTAVLTGDDLTLVLDCGGRSITLQGTRTHITLRGACAALTVRGEASEVRADLAPNAAVLVEGNGITLSYTVASGGAGPALEVRGMGSSAVREGSVVPPPKVLAQEAPLAPAPQAPLASVPQLMHDLDATVVAGGTAVPLPVAAFSASGLTPAGETQLARLASLIGQAHPSALRLTGRDPADPARAAQRRGVVKDWLRSHGVSVAMVDADTAAAAGVDVLLVR